MPDHGKRKENRRSMKHKLSGCYPRMHSADTHPIPQAERPLPGHTLPRWPRVSVCLPLGSRPLRPTVEVTSRRTQRSEGTGRSRGLDSEVRHWHARARHVRCAEWRDVVPCAGSTRPDAYPLVPAVRGVALSLTQSPLLLFSSSAPISEASPGLLPPLCASKQPTIGDTLSHYNWTTNN